MPSFHFLFEKWLRRRSLPTCKPFHRITAKGKRNGSNRGVNFRCVFSWSRLHAPQSVFSSLCYWLAFLFLPEKCVGTATVPNEVCGSLLWSCRVDSFVWASLSCWQHLGDLFDSVRVRSKFQSCRLFICTWWYSSIMHSSAECNNINSYCPLSDSRQVNYLLELLADEFLICLNHLTFAPLNFASMACLSDSWDWTVGCIFASASFRLSTVQLATNCPMTDVQSMIPILHREYTFPNSSNATNASGLKLSSLHVY